MHFLTLSYIQVQNLKLKVVAHRGNLDGDRKSGLRIILFFKRDSSKSIDGSKVVETKTFSKVLLQY